MRFSMHERSTPLSLMASQWDLKTDHGLRAFRVAIKVRLSSLAENHTDGLLDELSKLLVAHSAIVPAHAQTMDFQTLCDVVSLGVHVGSHGWDHRNIVGMSRAEDLAADDLRRANAWFKHNVGFSPDCYAVPYGVARIPWGDLQQCWQKILLADPARNPGFCGQRHWNRRDITKELQQSQQ